jgi:hypothetical protein
MVFAKSYLPFLPFTETLVTQFVKHYQLCVLCNIIKQQTKSIIYLASVLNNNQCNSTDISCLGGVFAKNTSLETKFPSPFDSGNFSSVDWYFSQIPLPNMIYLFTIVWRWHGQNWRHHTTKDSNPRISILITHVT